MSSLGQQLRAAREQQGLSPADVEANIKIRRPVLQALEEGNLAGLPPKAFARGLVRKYAEFLDLDPVAAAAQFDAEYGAVTPANFNPVLQEPLYRGRRDWAELLLGVGAVVLALAVVYGVFQYSILPLRQANPQLAQAPAVTAVSGGETPEAPKSSAAPSPTPPPPTRTPVLDATPVVGAPPTPTLLPTIGATATRSAPTPAPTVPSNEVEVGVEITQPSWIQVKVDGQQVFASVLQPGQSRSWRGQKSVTLRTGNAGGTIIFVNGQPLGTLGTPGSVVEREWQLGQADVLNPAPAQATAPPPPAPPTATAQP